VWLLNPLTKAHPKRWSRAALKKMAAARKASVNSHLGFVVPKLTGHEALHFMRSVGGFALSSKVKTSKPKS
jgi:hypothetical protein